VEGVDLGVVFAAPTGAEIAAVRAEWAARNPAPVDVQVVRQAPYFVGGTVGTLRVVSHVVDGYRHYGAVIAPATDRALPVLVLLHGGDGGVDVSDPGIAAVVLALGDVADDFVYVIPSFRSEPLEAEGTVYLSEGPPSPWDRDVDDAMALLGATFVVTQDADPARVAAVGFSRGGLVALLMGVRDPRVDRVVAFMGPTDFFDAWVEDLVMEALEGDPRDLPGLATLDALFLQPLKRGEIDETDMRRELIRRSAVLFAADLPPLQLHHGTADPVVSVSQAESMIAAMAALGRGAPEFEGYLYPGGVHDPLTMPGSADRAVAYLRPLTNP
jgi:dipeptidyl aminopeptidase/acylaminoacyl peptidase